MASGILYQAICHHEMLYNSDIRHQELRLQCRSGGDPCIRTGLRTLMPASDAAVDSKTKSVDNRELVTYGDSANTQSQGLCRDVCNAIPRCLKLESQRSVSTRRADVFFNTARCDTTAAYFEGKLQTAWLKTRDEVDVACEPARRISFHRWFGGTRLDTSVTALLQVGKLVI